MLTLAVIAFDCLLYGLLAVLAAINKAFCRRAETCAVTTLSSSFHVSTPGSDLRTEYRSGSKFLFTNRVELFSDVFAAALDGWLGSEPKVLLEYEKKPILASNLVCAFIEAGPTDFDFGSFHNQR